jgi:hypothetical protein
VSEESYLTDEDLQAIDAIVDGSRNRQMGQQLLDLMTARGDKDPFIELLNRAHQAKAEDDKE